MGNSSPKISVIIVAYKVEKFLAQCLMSVTQQTYENLEIILVLGTGDIACEKIGDDFARKDDRIVLLKKEPRGVAVARNHGLSVATGAYIGFVDGDDWVDADMFACMLNNSVRYDADISVIGKYDAYANGIEGSTTHTESVMNGYEAFEQLLYQRGFFLHLWDKLYKRALFETLRFPEGERVEDRKVGYQLLGMADRIVYDTAPKYYFRISEDSGSRVADNLILSLKNDYEMCDYILSKYPELSKAVTYFLVYENMSVIQNNILFCEYSKKRDMEYISYVRAHVKDILDNKAVANSIKIKTVLCAYDPWLFGKMTKARRNRFLKKHQTYQTGTDWTKTFAQLEKRNQ